MTRSCILGNTVLSFKTIQLSCTYIFFLIVTTLLSYLLYINSIRKTVHNEIASPIRRSTIPLFVVTSLRFVGFRSELELYITRKLLNIFRIFNESSRDVRDNIFFGGGVCRVHQKKPPDKKLRLQNYCGTID